MSNVNVESSAAVPSGKYINSVYNSKCNEVSSADLSTEPKWLPIEFLSSTDVLLLSNGETVKPGRIVKVEGRHTVYNFEVEGLHTYIAGGYRVHNDSQAVIDTAGSIGQAFGSQLGSLIGGDNQFAQIAAGTVLGAIGRNIAEEIADFGVHSILPGSYDFGSQFANFDIDIRAGGIGAISSFLTAEAGEALGLEGFGADLFNVTVGAYAGSVLNHVLGEGVSILSAAAWDQALFNLPNIGSFFGSQLAQEIMPAQSLQGMIGGSLGSIGGSALGVAVGGGIAASLGVVAGSIASLALNFLLPGVGAFVGTLLGTFLGDLFGGLFGDDEPLAFAELIVDNNTGLFYVYDIDNKDGGDRDVAEALGDAYATQLNEYVRLVGGSGFAGERSGVNPILNIGYDEDSRGPYRAGFGDRKSADWASSTPEGMIDEGLTNTITQLSIVGGDIFLKRAAANSKAEDTLTLAGDLQVAEDYAKYLADPSTINALIAAAPESVFAAGWMITFARAQELGLSGPNTSDFNGGLAGFLMSLELDSIGVALSDVSVEYIGNELKASFVTSTETDLPGHFFQYATNIKITQNTNIKNVEFIWNDINIIGFDAVIDSESHAGSVNRNEIFSGVSGKNNHVDTIGTEIYFGDKLANQYTSMHAGSDIIIGRELADILRGSIGWDWISGSAGDDDLSGKGGNDVLIGGTGNDHLEGGYGSDLLDGGAGSDALLGGEADIAPADRRQIIDVDTATYRASTAAVTVNLATGTGRGGWAEGDTVSGIESVVGSKFNDTLTGGASADILEGGVGADQLNGGEGSDTASYESSMAAVEINLGNGRATGGDATGDTLTQIENVIGSSFDDVLAGGAGANRLYGGAGDDQLFSGRSDTLDGGLGDDVFTIGGNTGVHVIERVGEGYDEVRANYDFVLDKESEVEKLVAMGTAALSLTGSATSNELVGNSAANRLNGGDGSDLLEGGAGADTLDGGAREGDVDIASYARSTAGVQVTLTAASQLGGEAEGDVLIGIEGVIGSAFNDVFKGDGEDNYFDGGAGADSISGYGGQDVVDYTSSNDAVVVNLVTRRGYGGTAHGDRYSTVEQIVGSSFDDELIGDGAANVLVGGAGSDLLVGGDGADTLDGGAGIDTVSYEASSEGVKIDIARSGDAAPSENATPVTDTLINIENVIGSTFADTISGNGADNLLEGLAGNDTLNGLLGADALEGGAGDDILNGGDGDDILEGGVGADTLKGGAGIDTVSYASATEAVRINFESSIRFGESTGDRVNAGSVVDIENLTGSAFNDYLGGNGFDNVITGGAGADKMFGNGGVRDFVAYSGSAAAVTVNFATGRGLGGDAQGDEFQDFEGVVGSKFDDLFVSAAGAHIFHGGAGKDTVDYSAAAAAISLTLVEGGKGSKGDALGDEFVSIERIVGSAFNDGLLGGAVGETFEGLGGNDTIRAGTGADTVRGGIGNDRLEGEDGADLIYGDDGTDTLGGGAGDDVIDGGARGDVINGGDGRDTVSYQSSTIGLTASLDASIAMTGDAAYDTIGADVENLTGSNFDDVLYGDELDNVIIGGKGADTINGGAGRDTVDYSASSAGVNINLASGQGTLGDAEGDILSGVEVVVGTAFADAITGSAVGDQLRGGDGGDTLLGGRGGDRIEGGRGDDIIAGGADSDTYVFAYGFGKDVVQDFKTSGTSEKIVFSAGMFSDFADMMATTTDVGADVVIALDDSNSVKLLNLSKSMLLADDFSYVG